MTNPIYTNVSNPQWADEENTIINCDVFFTEFNEFLPFTATPYDSMEYGVQIYNDCVSGLYGQIKPYSKPIPTLDENKQTAISLLQKTDWTSVADVGNPEMSNPYLENQSEFISYRNVIRQYAIYPIEGNIDWPAMPQENWQSV